MTCIPCADPWQRDDPDVARIRLTHPDLDDVVYEAQSPAQANAMRSLGWVDAPGAAVETILDLEALGVDDGEGVTAPDDQPAPPEPYPWATRDLDPQES